MISQQGFHVNHSTGKVRVKLRVLKFLQRVDDDFSIL